MKVYMPDIARSELSDADFNRQEPMEVFPLQRYPRQSLDNLLASIPFYKAVRQQDQDQYETLMTYSRIIEYRPGELLLEQGAEDRWLYFLLKGQLVVLVNADKENQGEIVNYITPGEVFGDMAFFIKQKRTATVMADPNCIRVLVFGTDITCFGELTYFRRISLDTKLIYYRNVVHNLRWKLEMYRMQHPGESFASDHRKVKLYSGTKSTEEELISLHDQAVSLSHLLVQWNHHLNKNQKSPKSNLDLHSLNSLNI